jgi:hypothetical protein
VELKIEVQLNFEQIYLKKAIIGQDVYQTEGL